MSSSASLADPAVGTRDDRKALVCAEQARLLYANSNVGAGVTVIAATALSYLQWTVIAHPIIQAWWLYMAAVALARFVLARRYRLVSPAGAAAERWCTVFTIGVALSAAGWGAAGIWLFPEGDLIHQVLLAFVLGGMMLGGGSILAARRETFLVFLIPAGLPASAHFFFPGNKENLAMGSLAAIFTLATVISTWRIYLTIDSALNLQFENEDLVHALRLEKDRVDSLNQKLELRVQERTAELHEAVALLREEIAERKLAEEERGRIEIDLRHAQKMQAVGVLAGGVAHDFNNILTSIAGYAELAQDLVPEDSEAYSDLEQVMKAAMRAGDLVRGLLVFSRKGAPSPTLISASAIVAEALELVRASIPATVEFRRTIDADCGCVFADPGLIHQVVINLCTNAYQAMSGGTGRLDVVLAPIDVGATHPGAHAGIPGGSYVRLAVSDTGPGIPPKIADRIFEPFFTTKAPGQGTGLGLSVVHGIITGYGGFIRFENHQPAGTTFFVYLPRVTADHPSEVQDLGPPPRGAGRILFVDDEEPIARLGARILGDLGYQVTPETSSVEALSLFSAAPHEFDLLVTDFAMPQINGGELIAQMKQLRPDIPVILISGFNEEVITADQGRRLGVSEYVRKPFTGAELAHAIRRVLDPVHPPGA
jgi:signal transduction histidine kinase/CheY-like chemotaxis protein